MSLLFSHEDLVGDDIIAVTQSQLNRLKKAHEASKGVTKKMSSTQVWGLASTGVQKLVGNGLYIKKGGCVCEVETDGRGLYLEPTSGKGFSKLGDGLYLKKDGKIYDGKGLLLGPNSPFKNIPILGMLL